MQEFKVDLICPKCGTNFFLAIEDAAGEIMTLDEIDPHERGAMNIFCNCHRITVDGNIEIWTNEMSAHEVDENPFIEEV